MNLENEARGPRNDDFDRSYLSAIGAFLLCLGDGIIISQLLYDVGAITFHDASPDNYIVGFIIASLGAIAQIAPSEEG